jgi:glutaconate CoA-transferase, subunit B
MSDEYKKVLRAGSDPLVFFRYPGSEEGPGYSKGHLMAAAIADALRDGETVVLGANGMLPLAAARLAQLTHAPNLTIIAGASGGVNTLVEPLVPSSGDYANLVAEAVLPFPDVISLQMSGRTDVFFAGGIQIDGQGNCNLVRTGGDASGSRGPGSAGLPWAQRSRRILLYTTSHKRSVLVPRVDFVSLPGWNGDDGGLGRPELLVTPLAVIRFSQEGPGVACVHPGVERETVIESTGFSLRWPDGEVPRTPAPTDVQMRLMREFDPDGLLAIVAGE